MTIGLGVGANLAVFALLHEIFLPASPFADPGRLLVVANTGPYFYEGSVPEGLTSPKVSGPDYRDLEEVQRSFSSLGGYSDGHVSVLAGTDRPRSVCRVYVTPDVLSTLGVRPIGGRLLGQPDFEPDAAGAAIVTEGLWRAYLASDPGVEGRAIRLDEQPFVIVGVIPNKTFTMLRQREGLFDDAALDRCVITPLARGRNGEGEMLHEYLRQHRDAPWLQVVGRLRSGTSLESARADLSALAERLRGQHPATNTKRGLRPVTLDAWRTVDISQLLLMLSVAAALAFLVACANAAGLVLTESVRREPELAMRQALGAGPAQLLRVVLVRAVLWSLPGALLGYVFGIATLFVVRWGASAGNDPTGTIAFGPLVLMAGLVLALLAGIVIGGVAAWSLRRRNLTESLREGGHGSSTGRRRQRATMVLVGVQVAAATTLAIGAALLVHSLWNVLSVDRGFDLDRGFVVQVRLPRSAYATSADQVRFFQAALARVRALAGVASAGVSVSPPLTDTVVMLSGGLEVGTPAGKRELNRLAGQVVTDGYLESLNQRLVRGRFFSEADQRSNALVVVVDESFCRAHLGGADPLASTLRFGRDTLAIVGVVGDIRQSTDRAAGEAGASRPDGTAYLLLGRLRNPPAWSFMVVRTIGQPAPLTNSTVRELLAVDSSACLDDPRTFSQLFAAKLSERRRILGLLGGFSALVLVLTALSLTGALAQFVAARSRDIAIRFAIGASRRHIIVLTSRHLGAALIGGLIAGAGGGLLLGRALANQLYGLAPTNPATLAGAFAGLVLIAAAAASGPLWRAARIDPASTLHAL